MHAGGQLPLALRYPPDQRLETSIDAPAGALAQLRALAESASADWLYLNGPAGVGKTHLALATCAAAEACGRRAAYVPLPAQRDVCRTRSMRCMERVVALDGVELGRRLAGGRARVVRLPQSRPPAGDSCCTRRRRAGGLPVTLPDLRRGWDNARGIVVAAGRSRAAGRPARTRPAPRTGAGRGRAGLVVRRVGRDLFGLTALLDRMDSASLAAQRRLTVPFLKETLGLD